MDISASVAVIALGLLGMFWYSQQKFKDKVLCIMHTQNGMRLEIWAPLRARHIRYRSSKEDAGMYFLIPAYACNTWYDKGMNKLFPALVKTWEFWWHHPYPQDPMSIERYDRHKKCPHCNSQGARVPAISWHTPETRNAAWQEHRHRSFAKAAQAQAVGTRRTSVIERYLPLVTFGALLFLALLLWQNGLLF